MTPDQYAQAVRDALADHPEREELLEDLDDHLAEIAAESEAPLEERLGPPQAYAEELVAAYGGRPQGTHKPRRGAAALSWVRRQAAYRAVADFLPQLRPGWWVLRGYALAMMVVSALGYGRVVPENPVDLLVVAAGILASVWYGRHAAGRVLRGFTVAGNAVVGIAIFVGMVDIASSNQRDNGTAFNTAQPAVMEQVSAVSGDVYNIQPYAKDGTPLRDILLYDQDGKPITLNPEEFGYNVDRSCGEPVLNRYPLPLVEDPQDDVYDAQGLPVPAATRAPSSCPTPSATSTPAPTATPTTTPTPKASKTK